jgi:hypothetical protein
MKTADEKRVDELRKVLGRIFDDKWSRNELEDFDGLRDKFVFHMTDATEDILRLAAIYQSDERPETKAAAEDMHAFFLHALPHLIAAGQIYDFVPETFEEQKGVHSLD